MTCGLTAEDVVVYVCVCNAVTDRQIRKAVHRGAGTLEAVSAELKVASCCGRCADTARQVIKRLHQSTSRTM